ncbi:MAG: hypothetical protein WKF37_01090 [Bryobacteraceae bacterium]
MELLGTQPVPDMMQEFMLLTSNWGAEYGVKASAQVLMITRSGTNTFHGSAYDYLQNSALNARDYLDRTGKRRRYARTISASPRVDRF